MTQQVPISGAKIRLTFLCSGDPTNVRTWSGTPYHILEALKTQFDVVFVVERPWPRWFAFARNVFRKLSGGAIDLFWSPFWSALAASGTISAVKNSGCDVVFAAGITPICARLIDSKPVVFLSDATVSVMAHYNANFIRLSPAMKRAAKALETRAISGAVAALLPSDWAAQSAVHDHGGDPGHVFKVPWGANLVIDSFTPPETRSLEEWRLLFVGTNWAGKGGDIALATIAELRRRGRPARIDIVGSAPSEPLPVIEGVTFHGFLDKNIAADAERLRSLFQNAHAFFLPTQFEALGIVFAEAAAYALPAVSYRTGGVPGMVVDGETGLLIEEGAGAQRFADAIDALFLDRADYLRMAQAALQRSLEALTWRAWSLEARRIIERRLAEEGVVQSSSLAPSEA